MQGFVFFLLISFLTGTADIPPSFFHAHAQHKTCCGRKICQCRHARGAHCPFRAMQKRMQHENHHGPRRPDALSGTQKTSSPGLIFKNPPCHQEKQSAVTGHAFSDFVIVLNEERNFFKPVWREPVLPRLPAAFLFDKSFDKPPQASLISV